MIGITKELIDIKDGLNEATALILAAKNGHGKIVELLLDKGADVDVRSSTGFQAIQLATWGGHLDVAKLIAKKHPEVLNSKDGFGETPLDIARKTVHIHIVDWLQAEKGVTE